MKDNSLLKKQKTNRQTRNRKQFGVLLATAAEESESQWGRRQITVWSECEGGGPEKAEKCR